MVNNSNHSWNLQSFLDSLIFELDKAQDALSVKGLNRKLTYMVKDMNLELQLFPEFDGDTVRFTTAKPGETGASKISFQLGSIRDTQIQEVTRAPLTQDDVSIEEMGLSEPQQKELKKLGIQSAEDLRRTVTERKVALGKITDNKVDYSNLADVINQSRRRQNPPKVSQAKVSQAQGKTVLTLEGENLVVAQSLTDFPAAVLNDQPVQVLSASENRLQLEVDPAALKGDSKQLQVALDPYAVFTMNLQP
ncbi:hypothetical protein NDI52_31200 [Leptolyngbya sp. PL-A3]|uniref:hypothetical protein n=1 Tax=Leptolyngbya sp. PL-A3 TaxID=2933911 RepID=UPI0032980CF7